MAIPTDLEQVRRNTNTTSTDYTDVEVQSLIDAGGVNCTSAQIWQWEMAKLTAKAAGLKKSSGGVESHEFQALKDQMDFYKSQYDFYKELCDEDKGYGTSLLKARPQSVAGVITQEDLDELT